MGPRDAATALACLFVGLAGGEVSGAQAPERPKPELVVPTAVEVVRLEVVVTEKRGHPRLGLRREDFVVREDGKPQPVVQFQAFARPPAVTPAPPSPAAAPTPAGAEEDEAEELLPSRYVVLVVDDVHMEFESLSRARKVLGRFLDEDLRPEDQAALVTTSGSNALSQEFTSDREALHDVLDRLFAQGRVPERGDVPYMSEYEAELIENGDSLAIEAAVEEVMQAGPYQDPASAEQVARRKAREVLAEAVYGSRLTLEALESLCRGLSALTGRKALFLVSDGFLPGLTAGTGTGFDLRRIADAATRAGVVVYCLDTGGLRSALPMANASSTRGASPTSIGTIEAARQRSEGALREAMSALAADTGGFLAENTNNLRAGLKEVLKDTETYYVLAYEPTNTKRDGGFRKIDVSLPAVPGLKVRTRAGYFAPDDRRLGGGVRTAEAEARRAEQRRAEMNTALRSLAPLAGIPVRLSADFVSLDGAAAQLVVSGSVDVATLPFVRVGDRRQATVETAALVYGRAGGVATTLATERSVMSLGDPDYERLLRGGLPYQKAVPLKPGRYQVRLAARHDGTGLLGSAWQTIEVPDLASGRLMLSSLFLMKDENDGAASPAAAGGTPKPALRSVQGQRWFGRGEDLYVQFYAYNPKPDASGTIDLVEQAEVRRGGSLLAAAAPEAMEGGEARSVVAHLSRIRLQPLEPGDYELRVTVTDRNANAMAARSVPFTVE
ncbi:MAG TPA: VWA domain-containing protein [Vicinamibacteria bacterium]|nr:VWA domain-containing protein [Vicinamibacteria bacterium]